MGPPTTPPELTKPAAFAETTRALAADEEPYSCTQTIPDDAIAPVSADPFDRIAGSGMLVPVETKRALGVDAQPYSCTVTIPDDAIATGSAPNAGFVVGAAGFEPATSSV